MSSAEPTEVALILDLSVDTSARMAALERLADADPEKALLVALEASENAQDATSALMMIGGELGRIATKHRDLTEFELKDITETALDAYFEHLK